MGTEKIAICEIFQAVLSHPFGKGTLEVKKVNAVKKLKCWEVKKVKRWKLKKVKRREVACCVVMERRNKAEQDIFCIAVCVILNSI